MPATEAYSVTESFIGSDRFQRNPLYKSTTRPPPPANVPSNDDGLRALAASGDWIGVISLADKLEDDAAKCAAPQPGESSSLASLSARLPYVLVQASAFFKLHKVGEAKGILDPLGDIESTEYVHPTSKQHIAPFSLRFLVASLPFFLDEPRTAQTRLYALLARCDEEVLKYPIRSTKGIAWRQRSQRVVRALVQVHFASSEYPAALRLMSRLTREMDEEASWVVASTAVTGASPTTDADSPAAEVEFAARFREARFVLQLQQYACLCLHSGCTALADRQFKRIADHTPALAPMSEDDQAMQAWLDVVGKMNDGFRDVFNGRFSDAARAFDAAASGAGVTLSGLSESTSRRENSAPRQQSDHLLQSSLCREVQLRAQASHSSCLAYAEHSDLTRYIPAVLEAMEENLRENPYALTHCDSFLADLVRMYTLRGDRRESLQRLSCLLQTYRYASSSLPNLERLI